MEEIYFPTLKQRQRSSRPLLMEVDSCVVEKREWKHHLRLINIMDNVSVM